MKNTVTRKLEKFSIFLRTTMKIARKYAWIAAVKAGGSAQVSKRVWQVEVRRLSIALRELYDGIDMELNKGIYLNRIVF